jgi:hypothetical protein
VTTTTNYALNPRPAAAATGWVYVAGTSETGNSTVVTGATDGPTLPDGTKATSYMRRTVTAAKTSGASGWSYGGAAGAPLAGGAGDPVAGQVYIRSSVTSSTNFRTSVRSGTTSAGSSDAGVVTLPAGQWVHLDEVMLAAAGAFDNAYLWAFQSGITQPSGSTLDVCCAQVEEGAECTDYLDGDLPTTDRFLYAWTGTANASPSTRTEWVEVTLLEADDPQPVQIVVDALTEGTDYVVVGRTGDGQTWPVPGGVGTATGEQIILVDNRSPWGTPITYVLTADGATRVSRTVTVAFDGKCLMQSLDGRVRVEFVWRDNALPRELEQNAATFPVPGRPRPPARFAPGGDGGGALDIRTDATNTRLLQALLLTGRPIVVRTDGTVRDWPAVELLLPLRASNQLWGGVTRPNDTRTDRVWSLEYVLVDDPEPSTPLSVWTWDDFDAAMAGKTWDDFDALFAASTWNDFDTYDWGQLL